MVHVAQAMQIRSSRILPGTSVVGGTRRVREPCLKQDQRRCAGDGIPMRLRTGLASVALSWPNVRRSDCLRARSRGPTETRRRHLVRRETVRQGRADLIWAPPGWRRRHELLFTALSVTCRLPQQAAVPRPPGVSSAGGSDQGFAIARSVSGPCRTGGMMLRCARWRSAQRRLGRIDRLLPRHHYRGSGGAFHMLRDTTSTRLAA
jgi:hypothetical protein